MRQTATWLAPRCQSRRDQEDKTVGFARLSRTRHIRLSAQAPPVHARSIFVRRLERLPIAVA